MTVTIQKAGQQAAKAAASAAVSASKNAKIPLRPPRAVTAEEADTILPSRESNKTTMTPWKGWFQRFLQDSVLSEDKFRQFRKTFFFMPDDVYDLQQSPMPAKKVPVSKSDPSVTRMYRYPAPGSEKPVREPEFEADEDPYDTGYFKKDTRRRYLSSELGDTRLERAKLQLMDLNDPAVQEEMKQLEIGPESSPGNNGKFATGPSDFDPSGLRATMSVTWSALERSLDEHMPDHLPEPVWTSQERDIIAWHRERDLPVPIGGYYAPLKVPVERRVARW